MLWSKIILASGVAAALLWSPTTSAGRHKTPSQPETVCENAKLDAARDYFRCLVRAITKANTQETEPSADAIARCDERFNRAFERSEAGDACHTPGGASTLREPIKQQSFQTAANLSTTPSCTTSGETLVCQLAKTTSAVDLAALVNTLSTSGVSATTPFWIQAWGGNGSDGNVCCDYGGSGGQGGYAQLTTNLSTLQNAFGTAELYYYMGLNGTFSANAGGDGGTATLVTVNDLTMEVANVTDTLLIAGGGGGGGGGRGKELCGDSKTFVFGENGGAGATAVSFSPSAPGLAGTNYVVKGADGTNSSNSARSGQGGQRDAGGTAGFGSSSNGGNPIAPLGGAGGNHDSPQIGFVNASGILILSSNEGGGAGTDGTYDAGGGGGAGGYTGGGGGVGAFGDTCESGAGGGGSSFLQVPPNSPTCAAAPVDRPNNPNGAAGFIQITFYLGECSG